MHIALSVSVNIIDAVSTVRNVGGDTPITSWDCTLFPIICRSKWEKKIHCTIYRTLLRQVRRNDLRSTNLLQHLPLTQFESVQVCVEVPCVFILILSDDCMAVCS